MATGSKTGAAHESPPGRRPWRGLAALSLTAIGIVYGDIGTSPLYAVREAFGSEGVAATPANVLAVLSLIFWTLAVVVSIKYLIFALSADNRGEGGILALSARVTPYFRRGRTARRFALLAGLAGAALLYGDSMITPAISVLSAVEGLEVAAPELGPFVIPLTVGILLGLFALQRRGTARVGTVFAPITLAWFLVIALLGLSQIARTPEVLAALHPVHAVRFFSRLGLDGFLVLGAVFLVATGAEALYADLGHFGRAPIRIAWFTVALPALVLNYFGQGALILRDPGVIAHPFYMMAPPWALYPLVGLATAATVIASQAVITGAFSLTRQAVQLGYLPRMRIAHTSSELIGQIYMPFVNWVLMLACIGLVLGFRSTSGLAAAYGVAVSTNMVLTTLLLAIFARYGWRWEPWRVLVLCVPLLGVDLVFWMSNLVKVPHGGWFPLVVAAILLLLMTTWRRGSQVVASRVAERSLRLEDLGPIVGDGAIARVGGTAVFLNKDRERVPVAFLHNLKHNKVLHERIVFVNIRSRNEARVDEDRRCDIRFLGNGVSQITLSYGFIEDIDIPHALSSCLVDGRPVEGMTTTYFLGRDRMLATGKAEMPSWRAHLFAWMNRNSERPTVLWNIPSNRVVELGSQVEL